MKSKFLGLLFSLLLIILIGSGSIGYLYRFFLWLFTLQYSAPETSVAAGIVVRILTFLVSYSLVGIVFGVLNWFDKKAMSLAYFVLSTILGFGLSYIVWKIEKHILIVGLVLGGILFLIAIFIILINIFDKRKLVKNE